MNTVLVVDDNKTLSRSLEVFLCEEGYEALTAETGEEGLQKVSESRPEIVLLDLKLPDLDGIQVLRKIKDIDRDISVIIITAYGQIKTAVETMRLGAYDYINKPLNLGELRIIIEKALENLGLKRQIRRESYGFWDIIGDSPEMRKIYQMVGKVASGNTTTVLIRGETGTGKGLLARTIHSNSQRNTKPFIKINCNALPDNLIESELFGHETGAFTDAKSLKKGLIEEADGGTMFLDEIGDLPLTTQTKLLDVIEEKTFRRIGGTKDLSVDIRIIASTNRNLEEAVKEGKLRKDFFYRLEVVPIYLPPLRERKGDIPLLVKHFLKRYSQELSKKVKSLSNETMERLIHYHWPGNVRELKNLIERTYLLENGEVITPENLFPKNEKESSELSSNIHKNSDLVGSTLEEIERYYIKETLKRTGGRKIEASKVLGISLNTLKRKLRN